MAIIKQKFRLHSCKEENFTLGVHLGLTGQALKDFQYTLHTVEFDVAVDVETGKSAIEKVNGYELARNKEVFETQKVDM